LSNFLSFIFLLPFIIWSTFQPILFIHATMIEETLNTAAYESLKKASLQGKYDEAIYAEIKNKLVKVHHYDPDKIEINGTENITLRGDMIYLEITVPKPMMNVIDIFKVDSSEPFNVRKNIMSEFTP
jgi:hypothetical protein